MHHPESDPGGCPVQAPGFGGSSGGSPRGSPWFTLADGARSPGYRTATGRALRDAAAGVVATAFLVALPLLAVVPTQRIGAAATARDEASLLPLRALDITVPAADACRWWKPSLRVSIGAQEVVIDEVSVGNPAGPIRDDLHWPAFERLDGLATLASDIGGGVDFHGELTVDVDRTAPWSTVQPILAAAAGARFGVVAFTSTRPQGLCGVEAELIGPEHPTAGTRRAEPRPRATSREIADRFAELLIEKPGTERVVTRIPLGDPVPDDATEVQLVPAPEHTAQQVVDAIGQLDGRIVALVVAPDPVEPEDDE